MLQDYPSYAILKTLAQSPLDLRENLTEGRIKELALRTEWFDLLYASERVDEKVLEALYTLADEARVLDQMRAMQEGKVMNAVEGVPSENRSVLHTAMRDLFGSRQEAPIAKEAANASEKEMQKLEAFLKKEEDRFTDCVQIGIGGSDLGPRALYLAMENQVLKGKKAHFISNVDPDDAFHVLAGMDLSKTLVVVVSKSGTTLETLTNETLVRSVFEKKGLNPKEHFVAVTGEKSPMDNPERYLASFYIWDFVGGRYSATSMVGAVTLSFALGISCFREILQGAHAMDLHALQAPLKENLPLLGALLGIWNHNFLEHPTVAVLPYSQALVRFPAHLQQLDMESNGKSVDRKAKKYQGRTGPVVWGEVGTNGQHSFYQLIHQGTEIIPIEFIGFWHSQRGEDLELQGTTSQQKLLSNLFAQSIALSVGQDSENPNQCFEGNRPNHILMGRQLTSLNLGALLAYFEHKVAFQGFIWDINSFDQEGVQLGKKLASKMLDLYQEQGAFSLGSAYLQWNRS